MAEVYNVFTKISMVNGVSAVLGVVAKEVLSLEAGVQRLQKAFTSLNRTSMAVGGAFSAAAGAGALTFMKHAVDKAADLQSIQERLIIGGVDHAKVMEATAKAYDVAAKSGQKVADVLETMSEIRNPLGGINEAMHHIDKLGEAMTVLRSLDHRHGTGVAGQVYNLVRSAEFRNAVSGPEFDKAIDMMTRAAVATGGRVNPTEFFQFSKYARGALPGLSDRFLYLYGPELAQEFKGSSAGTALSSLYGQVVGGKMTTRGARILDDLDMIEDGKADYDKEGRLIRVKPGGVVGSGEFVNDPDKWAARLVKAMEDHGIKDKDLQGQYMASIFGNRLAEQMVKTLAFQGNRLDRGAAGIAQTMDIGDAAAELRKHDYKTNLASFHTAWDNLLTALGSPLIPSATSALNTVTEAINRITASNPETLRIIAIGVAALGGIFLTAGVVAMLAAIGTGGALIVGIGALGVAIGTWMSINWDTITSGIRGIGEALSGLWDRIKAMLGFGGGDKSPYRSGSEGGGHTGGLAGLNPLLTSYHPGGAANDNGTWSDIGQGAAAQSFSEKSAALMPKLMSDFGLTKEQAAGVLGNLGHETGGFRHMQELNPLGGGRGGLGWAQWTGPRRKAFEAYSRFMGLNPNSDAANYGFFKHELTHNYAHALRNLRGTSTVDEAMRQFEHDYEGAGVKGYGSRGAFARRALRPIGPPPATAASDKQELHVYLDGDKLEHHVTRRQVAKAKYPTAVGGHDSYGNWADSGMRFSDVG